MVALEDVHWSTRSLESAGSLINNLFIDDSGLACLQCSGLYQSGYLIIELAACFLMLRE